MKRIFIYLAAIALVFNPGLSLAKKKVKNSGSCRAVIFSNSTKGIRLYGKNEYTSVLPASTVKVMTALLVLENLPLDKYITVSPQATYVQPSKINVRSGEEYKVQDLLYALLLNSANDASVVLAEAVAGSEAKFVAMMNRRAKQLGAKHSHFVNSNGLPARRGTRQYTTAYDMYLIYRQALKNPFFENAVKKRYKVIYSRQGREIILKNHNKMLFKGWDKDIQGKTGWTRRAGGCFIGTVEHKGDDLIIGVFGCTSKRWEYIRQVVTRYGGVNL